jgi:hypothetical protein
MTVAARGVNATIMEKDIGTINGVIHVIDRILGVPSQDCGQMMAEDPNMRLDQFLHGSIYLSRRLHTLKTMLLIV